MSMKSKKKKQYTIRGISEELDIRLQKMAQKEGTSLNSLVVELLAKQADLAPQPVEYRDLDALSGVWAKDSEFDQALEDQRQIESRLWK